MTLSKKHETEYRMRIQKYISRIAEIEEISRAIELEIGARELKDEHPEFVNDLNPYFSGTSTTMLSFAQKGLQAEHHELYTRLASATYNSARENGSTLPIGLEARDKYPLNHDDYDDAIMRFASDGIPIDHVESYHGLPARMKHRMMRVVANVVYTHLTCVDDNDNTDPIEVHEAVIYRQALVAKKRIPNDVIWDKGVRITSEDVTKLLRGTGYVNHTADDYFVSLDSDNMWTISSPSNQEWGVYSYEALPDDQMNEMSTWVNFEV